MFRALSKGKHEITLEEWLRLFQPKDIRGISKGFYDFLVRAGTPKIPLGLPEGIKEWKGRFLYVSEIG